MRTFSTLENFLRLDWLLYTCLVGFIFSITPAYAVFDPVNDDTDIFLANPDRPAGRPNVLLILDNTANWSRNVAGQAIFVNEKTALSTVVTNLTNQFNVGLMLFAETGSPNDNQDGGVVRFHVRQMTTENKTILNDIVTGFDELNDKGNNNTVALDMFEAYRYYAGKASIASFGKVKTDFTSNHVLPHEATVAGLSGFALPNSPTSSSLFNSPITDACQSNFIIYISNGQANENAAALAQSEAELESLGYDTSSTINLDPNGQEGNWMDEWAKYMATADVNDNIDGIQNVSTYVVEVDPVTTGLGPDMTALLKSVALNGKGRYFKVTSANNGQAIVNALNQIFSEIQAVNSVFASTTLPVSVNVRGTNLNQVYIGVFRPDGSKSPRWYGNLKMYQLGFDPATSTLFLADANGQPAENPDTGFINSTSPSFWTSFSTFWSFRDATLNGPGGSSDLPDGDLVEKGGAAQQERADYATSQASRNVYTCTGTCTVGSKLSDTPFSTTNTDINAASMGLGTVEVSSLTGFVSKDVASITDTKIADSLNTATNGYYISLDNSSVNQNVTNLTGLQTKQLTNLVNSQVTIPITSLVNGSGSTKSIATAVAPNHGLSTGSTVTIDGAAVAAFNGTFIVQSADSNTFTYDTNANIGNNTDAGGTPSVVAISSVVTAELANHGFRDGQTVTITGVVPSDYNGTYTIASIGANSANQFSFLIPSGLGPITDASNVFVSGQSKTATVTVPNHGYADGSTVTIAGANSEDFNGNFTIKVIDADTFTYTLPVALGDDSSTTITSSQGSNTVTVTTLSGPGGTPYDYGHTYNVGDTITIVGAVPSGYNGTYKVDSVLSPTSFTYTTPLAQPANTETVVYVTIGTSTLAVASIPNHGFGPAGTYVNVIIQGVTNYPNAYNGKINAYINTPNSITYTTVDGSTPTPATGTISVRLNTAYATAFAKVYNHGYSDGDVVTIKNANNGYYNQSDATITVIDADNFKFQLTSPAKSSLTGLGADTSTVMTSNVKTTTAVVRAVNHGFVTSDSVTMAGATPAAFNGVSSITKLDDNTFTYTLGSPQGDATGTILASSGSGPAGELDKLISWIRGQDNLQDENGNGSLTDARASIHGDVLHSRPAVVNYNRFGADFPDGPDGVSGTADDNTTNDDVYVFYGSNDGLFRAVKGGFGQSDLSDSLDIPGHERWSFIPEEFFSKFRRLRNNEPIISSSNKKPYFADGTIGTYALDYDEDGKLDLTGPDCGSFPKGANCDKVYLYISMRRGGRLIYALDVTDPLDPRLLWKHSSNDAGLEELGYTWSAPIVTSIDLDVTDGDIVGATDDGIDNPVRKLVVIMGAGYDPEVEDLDPTPQPTNDPNVFLSRITNIDSSTGTVTWTVNSTDIDYVRSMGRGVVVLDAETGNVLWQAGPSNPTGGIPGDHFYKSVSGMIYAMPSDPTIITDRTGSVDNRVYIPDTGGNVWRIDMKNHVADWTVSRLASVADHSVQSRTQTLPDGSTRTITGIFGMRKFLYPPDVVYSDNGYDAVLIGSGDREHAFDTSIDNRFYMFKDMGTGTTFSTTNLAESDLFDVTSNCIQDAAACTGGTTPTDAMTALTSADGWMLRFTNDGEKSIGNSVTLNNVVFFNTNQPGASAEASLCASDLGIARQYRINFEDATAILDQNVSGGLDAGDRAEIHAGGGYLPSPVPLVVEIDGQVHEGVISGTAVDQPPGSVLNARTRKFWYKEID